MVTRNITKHEQRQAAMLEAAQEKIVRQKERLSRLQAAHEALLHAVDALMDLLDVDTEEMTVSLARQRVAYDWDDARVINALRIVLAPPPGISDG